MKIAVEDIYFYRITETHMDDGRVHIQNSDGPGIGGGAAMTLCGYVDVLHEQVEGPATCPACRTIARWCQSLPAKAFA